MCVFLGYSGWLVFCACLWFCCCLFVSVALRCAVWCLFGGCYNTIWFFDVWCGWIWRFWCLCLCVVCECFQCLFWWFLFFDLFAINGFGYLLCLIDYAFMWFRCLDYDVGCLFDNGVALLWWWVIGGCVLCYYLLVIVVIRCLRLVMFDMTTCGFSLTVFCILVLTIVGCITAYCYNVILYVDWFLRLVVVLTFMLRVWFGLNFCLGYNSVVCINSLVVYVTFSYCDA